MNLYKALCFTVCLLPINPVALADPLVPNARYAAIDIYTQQRTIKALVDGDEETIQQVIEDSGRYAPPVLYLLSNILLTRGRGDEAMYWFYTGQLRGTSDIQKVHHESAHQAVMALNEYYGPAINYYAFQNIARLEQVIEEVVRSDAIIKRRYDPRWVALHGKETWISVSLTFEPAEHWEEINSEIRLAYLAGFREAINEMKGEASQR